MRTLEMITISMLTLAATVAFAQQPDPAQLALQYSQAAKQNAAMLTRYSWKMRTEVNVTVQGEAEQVVKLYEVRFDLDGRPQKTELTAPRAPAEPPKRGIGIRTRIKNAKKQEIVAEYKRWAGELSELVESYTTPSAGTMLDFYSEATYTPVENGLVKVEGRDFLQPGDSVTFVIDAATKAPRSFAFKTLLGRDTVQGNVEYGQAPAGPRYAARTTVHVPAKSVTAKVETYEYRGS
ncbi:MAG: hypothetical protein MI919_05600 [Holophagales bacterium]|nr:hypothetical protein [Holophagales bacterium]